MEKEKEQRFKTRLTLKCKHGLFDDNSNCKFCKEADRKKNKQIMRYGGLKNEF